MSSAPSRAKADSIIVNQEPLSALPMFRVNLLRELKNRQIAVIRLPVVYNNGRLSDGFAELFSLTSREKEALRSAIDAARSEIGALSLANAKITHGASLTVISVPPFDGGAEVYDRLQDSFQQVLGPERYSALNELHTDELPRVFNSFGAESRTISISYNAASATYRLDDNRKTSSGHLNRSESFSDPAKISDLNQWLIPIVQQMPSAFVSPLRQ